ncbi:hypothetical protein CDCA_CDCA04G1225 [Cyanidium caldarium]|uniref:EcxA zinc-binding domain-containing protein n=1 Tax=Cyanidium caldarium TaxID=2771 RepID=A0AAV9ISX2_CYACA|nr:hypothetical protein CDCA_CDCA04G1225 [Cyanidium caldarium]
MVRQGVSAEEAHVPLVGDNGGDGVEPDDYWGVASLPPHNTPRHSVWRRRYCGWTLLAVILLATLSIAAVVVVLARQWLQEGSHRPPADVVGDFPALFDPQRPQITAVPFYSEKQWQKHIADQYVHAKRRGFFGLYLGNSAHNDTANRVLLEVPVTELDRAFVIDALYTRGDGEALLLDMPANMLRQNWFALRVSEPRPARTLDVYRPQLDYRIGSNRSELALAFARGTWTGWSRTLQLKAVVAPQDATPRRRIPWLVVDVSDWVAEGMGVLGQSAAELRQWLQTPGRTAIGWDMRAVAVRTFPQNAQVRTQLMVRGVDVDSTVNPGSEYAAEIAFNLVRLPERPLPLRLADERIGYFTTSFTLLDHAERVRARVDLLNRRRLPVAYYVDETVPQRWREPIRRAVHNWQRAFQAAGWDAARHHGQPAIRAVLPGDADWPADYDLSDVRYNTISWAPSVRQTFALGPSNVDPRTGEVIHSNIVFTHGWIRAWLEAYERMAGVAPEGSARYPRPSGERQWPLRGRRRWATASFGHRQVVASRVDPLSAHLLHSVALSTDVGAVPDTFVEDALIDTTMHEVGHTLGLRHNFRGSANVPWDKLSDRAYVEAHGITSSVMDYCPVLVMADATRQVRYFQHVVGDYDVLAIRYGYADLAATAAIDAVDRRVTHRASAASSSSAVSSVALTDTDKAVLAQVDDLEAVLQHPQQQQWQSIAQTAVRDGLHFGTDEDDPTPTGPDALVSMWDMSSDPLQYHDNVRLLLERMAPHAQQLLQRYRLPWTDYGRFVDTSLRLAERTALYAAKYLGSVEVWRARPQEDGTASPRRPMRGADMRRALQLLARLISPAEPGALLGVGRPEWNRELIAERGTCSGVDTYCLGMEVVDVLRLLRESKQSILGELLRPQRLSRIRQAAGTADDPAPLPFTEYLSLLTEMLMGNASVWGAMVYPSMAAAALHDSQTLYVSALLDAVTNSTQSAAEPTAHALMVFELRRIHCQLQRALRALPPSTGRVSEAAAQWVALSSRIAKHYSPLDAPGPNHAATLPCP